MSKICVKCKGYKKLCGRSFCPLLKKKKIIEDIKPKVEKKNVFGSSPPSFFTGEQGYPKVLAGPMVPAETGNTEILASPEKWGDKSIEDIIKYRSSLVRTSTPIKISDARKPDRIVREMQEIILSESPIDVEAQLKKKPKVKLEYNDFSAPLGPNSKVEKLDIAENPDVPKTMDKLLTDELKTQDSIKKLYNKDVSVSYINKVLSAGLLGSESRKKFVPTRWSITGTDDMISKEMIQNIKRKRLINDYEVYMDEYLGNRYVVLLFPTGWKFEVLECWLSGTTFTEETTIVSDHEIKDRTEYAEDVAGGYYASRIAVTEHLKDRGRQAGAIVFREVHPSYYAPLGVWQVREGTRKALKNLRYRSDDLEEIYDLIKNFLFVDMDKWKDESSLISYEESQTTIERWYE